MILATKRATLLLAMLLLIEGSPLAASETRSEQKPDWGPEVEGYRLSITTAKNRYGSGEKVILEVVLQNTGDQQVGVSRSSLMSCYEITILSPDMQKVPLTLKGKRESDAAQRASAMTWYVEPNERISDRVHLNRLFDMTLPKEYTVSVSRKVPKREQKREEREYVTVTSNTLVIKVDEEEEAVPEEEEVVPARDPARAVPAPISKGPQSPISGTNPPDESPQLTSWLLTLGGFLLALGVITFFVSRRNGRQ